MFKVVVDHDTPEGTEKVEFEYKQKAVAQAVAKSLNDMGHCVEIERFERVEMD